MYESLTLKGNPICNKNPQLANISNDMNGLQEALATYFGQGPSNMGGIPTLSQNTPAVNPNFASTNDLNKNKPSTAQSSISQGYSTKPPMTSNVDYGSSQQQ